MARIMVVEDEPITAADLEQKLTTLGHEVTALLDTGEEAVAQARQVAPDLVLMDIRLRGAMDGIEAASRLRADNDVPLVFLTAFADQETVDRACETQPYGYLLKPFTERSVATAVQVALSRARAEQAQLERERWISAGLRGAGEALVAVDVSGAIRFLNEHAEALLNVKERDVLGKTARSVVRFAEDERGDATHPLESALRESHVTSSARRALRPAGDRANLQVSFSAAPVSSARGEKVGAVLVFREASPREGASNAESLAALGRFSLQLSHEINSPLTYNLGALQLALRELDQLRAMSAISGATADATGQRERQLLRIEELLRNAHEGATRMASVMRELSSLTASEGQPSPLLPVELLDLAIGLSGLEGTERLRLVRRVEPAPVVRANKWQLARVLAHALQSIVHSLHSAVPSRSLLELRLSTDARGWAEIRVHARHEPGLLTTPAAASCASPEEPVRQAGIAVTVAAQVVENLGGELTFSEEGDARLLTLRLPPANVVSTHAEPKLRAEPAAPRGSVLVVDDEPMIGRVLEIALQPEHDVTSVLSAEKALELLDRGDAFDVILCDLSMPGMDGQQFYEKLCESRPEIASRVIIMSGGARTERGARFLEQMRGRRIDKPFRTDELLSRLAERVEMRRTFASRAQA